MSTAARSTFSNSTAITSKPSFATCGLVQSARALARPGGRAAGEGARPTCRVVAARSGIPGVLRKFTCASSAISRGPAEKLPKDGRSSRALVVFSDGEERIYGLRYTERNPGKERIARETGGADFDHPLGSADILSRWAYARVNDGPPGVPCVGRGRSSCAKKP